MHSRYLSSVVALLLAVAGGSIVSHGHATPAAVPARAPLITTFLYEGRLVVGGVVANGTYDFRFQLFNAASGGTAVGSPTTVEVAHVAVTSGQYSVALSFGANAFTGAARWLQIGYRMSGGTDDYALLVSRETLVPYALVSSSTGALRGRRVAATAPASGEVLKWNGRAWVPAPDASATYTAGTGLALEGTTFAVDQQVIQARVADACPAGWSINEIGGDGTIKCETYAPADHQHVGQRWSGANSLAGLRVTNTRSVGGSGLAGSSAASLGGANGFAGVRGTGTHPVDSFGVVGVTASSTLGAGVGGFANAGNAAGVLGYTTSGDPAAAAIRAEYAGAGSGTALEIKRGAVRVVGAGIGTSTPAFIHVVTPATRLDLSATVIDHPLTNGDPRAILIITRNSAYDECIVGLGNPEVSVAYAASIQKWLIANEDPLKEIDGCFNVLVIKP